MGHQILSFTTSDGQKLFGQSWMVDKPVADLILIHGVGEHSSRYQWSAEMLNDKDISVHSFDLRGHGHSEGDRAYIDSFEQFLEDVHTFIGQLQLEYDNFFLLGHSMGGLIVSRYLADHPESNCKGVVLSAPALKVGDDISPLLVKMSSIISSLFPKLKTTRLDSNFISRDPKVVEAYNADPLVYHDGIKARMGAEMIRTMTGMRGAYPAFKFPLLIMHGSGDKLADLQGSRWMVDEVTSDDKTLEVLPGFYHEILNEPEKEAVIQKIIKWILDRI